ncbi:RNase H domain-containing protein [Trichonephila clavipes]|nr:RNase H domain-containing protein [Trichonephila clavipes]
MFQKRRPCNSQTKKNLKRFLLGVPSGGPHSKTPPKNTCFELELLRPCSKKEDPAIFRQKGLETIEILSQDNFAIAYTDGSSERSLSNGGAGKSSSSQMVITTNTKLTQAKSSQTSQVNSRRLEKSLYYTNKTPITAEQQKKSCILQWIPAHVNIESNECADNLAKEARVIDHKRTTITLYDANAVDKHRIMNHTFKKPLVTEFDCPRIITSTIARLRAEHLKGMKIHPDKTRSYVQCKHCPDLQLTSNHILECPTVATKLLKMGMVPLRNSLQEILYSHDAPRIAEAVIKTFDGI